MTSPRQPHEPPLSSIDAEMMLSAIRASAEHLMNSGHVSELEEFVAWLMPRLRARMNAKGYDNG
ncbi:MAG: hypothetical protein D6773_08665 [Alphaproteobacteria bacterium]|nr:MAG: hypothetical protein D6773_08665 [Alphaproteobacteria bacterium]